MKYIVSTQRAFLLIAVSMLLAAPFAAADSFTGRIVGINCAKAGKICPYDGLEKHLETESDFVLLAAKGEYYLLKNITRDVLVRYVLKQVIVDGTLNKESATLAVEALKVQGEGLSRYKTVWEYRR